MFRNWARNDRGASDRDVESCRGMFEQARRAFNDQLQRGGASRRLELPPAEMESMLGLYGRHAKQAAALRELLSDIEKTLSKVRVETSDEGRRKECVAFFRAKMEFEANERQNREAMQTFETGRGEHTTKLHYNLTSGDVFLTDCLCFQGRTRRQKIRSGLDSGSGRRRRGTGGSSRTLRSKVIGE